MTPWRIEPNEPNGPNGPKELGTTCSKCCWGAEAASGGCRGCGCPCTPGHCARCSEQSGFRETGGDGAEQDGGSTGCCCLTRCCPGAEAGSQGCTRIPNGIKGLLAQSSHPNPAGRRKVRLGQKALAVRAWPWPLTSVQVVGPGQQPPSPHCCHVGGHSHWPAPWTLLGTPVPHGDPSHAHGRGSMALARLRWASVGRVDSLPRSSCCPAKFLFFSEIPNSMPGKNKRERSRCLALCRVAARAQPWLSVENTNSRAGLVHRQKLRKQLEKIPSTETPDPGVWEGVRPSCFGA